MPARKADADLRQAPRIDVLTGDVPDDAVQALSHVHQRAFGHAWSDGSIANLLSTPGSGIIVARHDGSLAGFLVFRKAADEIDIVTAAVDPRFQRRGVGRRLIDGLKGWASQTDARVVHLEVACDNAPAIALYGGAGFAVVGRRANYYRRAGPVDRAARVDAICMALDL